MELNKKQKYFVTTVIILLVVIMVGGVIILENSNKAKQKKANLEKFLGTDVVNMYNKNELDPLVDKLSAKLKENPDNTDVLLSLANAYLQRGSLNYKGKEASTKARVYIQKVLKQDKNNIGANLLLGYSYELEGNLDQAIKIYQQTIKLSPKYSRAYTRLGHTYEMEGKYDLAIKNYKKAMALDKNNADAYINLAKILAKAGREGDAINLYQKALKLSSNNEKISGIYVSLGSIYSSLERNDKNKENAVKMLKKAIEFNPKSSIAYANLENEYYLRLSEDKDQKLFINDLKNIEYYYNQAVKVNPNESIIYQWYGLTMIIINKPEEAIKVFNTGIKAVDNDTRLFGTEKNDQKARFYIAKSIIYAQSDNPKVVDLSFKYLKMALNLNKNLFKDAIVKDLNKKDGGYFSKVKDDPRFKEIISAYK